MNEGWELPRSVKSDFAGVTLTVPVAATVARGRQLRARWRIVLLSCAIVVAAGVALATATLLGGGGAAPSQGTQLSAWTVTRQLNGLVVVNVNQLRDPAGLQRALRADGVPAAVNFQRGAISLTPPLPRECHDLGLSDKADADLQEKILVDPTTLGTNGVIPRAYASGLIIRPTAIPKGIGINLTVQFGKNSWGWGLGLVRASLECTGS